MPASFGGPGGTYPTLASAELAPNYRVGYGISEHPKLSLRR